MRAELRTGDLAAESSAAASVLPQDLVEVCAGKFRPQFIDEEEFRVGQLQRKGEVAVQAIVSSANKRASNQR